MKVILQERIANLGVVGDQVNVKSGYARNFLIPKGMALMATAANVAEFEKRREALEKKAAEKVAAAEARKAALSEIVVTIAAQAGDEGKLFGSIGSRDIADAVSAKGVALDKSEIRLPEGPIRAIGEHEVTVYLHSEVNASVKIVVEAE